MDSAPWYRDGLRFECTRSGNCCGGAPGVVRVTEQDITDLARCLQLSDSSFRDIYTRDVGESDLSLKEKSNHDCIFFERAQGCTVYQYRPQQCRTWPFWHHVVNSPDMWAREAQHCPGMNRGRLHSAEEIKQISENDGTFD
jgi:Fe-S-cluster containining protein